MNRELVHLQQVERANRVEYSTVLVVHSVKIKNGNSTRHPPLSPHGVLRENFTFTFTFTFTG